MAILKRKQDDLGELRTRAVEARRKVKEVEAARRAGRATPEMLAEGTRAAKEGIAAKRELDEKLRAGARRAADVAADKGRPPRVPLRFVNDVFPVELKGARLDGRGFTDDEQRELHRLSRARRDGPLSDKDRRSLERLVDVAAEAAWNGPGFLARRRREIAAAEKQEADARRLHLSVLPRRPMPEPGSIELPRFVFEWVTDGKEDTFDLMDAALLAGLTFGFANETGAMFARCRFDRVDGIPTLTFSDAGRGVHLARGVDPSRRIQVASSLDALRRNKWIETRQAGGTYWIRPGERMRKLLGEAVS